DEWNDYLKILKNKVIIPSDLLSKLTPINIYRNVYLTSDDKEDIFEIDFDDNIDWHLYTWEEKRITVLNKDGSNYEKDLIEVKKLLNPKNESITLLNAKNY